MKEKADYFDPEMTTTTLSSSDNEGIDPIKGRLRLAFAIQPSLNVPAQTSKKGFSGRGIYL